MPESESGVLAAERTGIGWEWTNRTPEASSKGSRLATNRTPIKTWGDRRESNSRRLVHSQPPEATRLRPHLVPGVGIEPTFTAFQTVANPSQLSRRTLVAEEGIEPILVGAYETPMCTSSVSPHQQTQCRPIESNNRHTYRAWPLPASQAGSGSPDRSEPIRLTQGSAPPQRFRGTTGSPLRN